MKDENKNGLIISVLIPLTIGALSSLLSGNMSEATFNQPSFAPPSYVFPIVWTILYTLMGISSYIIFISEDNSSAKALKTYFIQLFFNFFWSILFFRFSLYLPSFLWLIIMIVLIIIMIWQFYQISPAAAYLQIPYLLWCLFAAYLNFMIYLLN